MESAAIAASAWKRVGSVTSTMSGFTSSSRFAALRTGKSMSGVTDAAGMNAIRGLSDGESTAITCFCPAPVGAVVCRCGEK